MVIAVVVLVIHKPKTGELGNWVKVDELVTLTAKPIQLA
jgi:hypothetical protein